MTKLAHSLKAKHEVYVTGGHILGTPPISKHCLCGHEMSLISASSSSKLLVLVSNKGNDPKQSQKVMLQASNAGNWATVHVLSDLANSTGPRLSYPPKKNQMRINNFLCINSKFPNSTKAVVPMVQFLALSLHHARLICVCTFFF